jgi:hypothetical protein
MKSTVLILGNITFEGLIGENTTKAIVHEISGILHCEGNEKAIELGEMLSNEFHSYVIPEIYKGEIEYHCNRQIGIYSMFI